MTVLSENGGDRVKEANSKRSRIATLLLSLVVLVGITLVVTLSSPAQATDTSSMSDLILDFVPIILLLAILGMMIGMFSKFSKGFGK